MSRTPYVLGNVVPSVPGRPIELLGRDVTFRDFPLIPNFDGNTFQAYPHQAEALTKLDNPANVGVVDVDMGGGKCAVSETCVHTAEGILELGELWSMGGAKDEAGLDAEISLGIHGEHSTETASHVYYDGRRKTVKVKTELGYESQATYAHRIRVLSPSGDIVWKRHRDLKVGDTVAIKVGQELWGSTSTVDVNGTTITVTAELARILGYLISDDSYAVSNHQMEFTQKSDEIRNDFIRCLQACFSTPRFKQAGMRVDISNNNVKETIAALGFPVGYSKERSIPKCVRTAPRHIVVEFLKALFEGDGYICDEDKGNVYYATSSKRLHRQLKVILANMGILSNSCVQYKSASNGLPGNSTKLYTITLNHDHAKQFIHDVGFISQAKRQAAIEVVGRVENATSKVARKVNDVSAVDGTFAEMWKALKGACTTRGVSLSSVVGKRRVWFDRVKYGQHVTKQMLAAFVDTLDEFKPISNDLRAFHSVARRLADPLLCFSKINYVKHVDVPLPVFDLHVPGTNTYCANGMIQHNSMILTCDILNHLNKGTIRKPLWVMPRNTINQQVEEVEKYSGGKVNCLVLTTTEFNHVEADRIVAAIINAPPNTIFMTSYSFLKHGPKTVVPTGYNLTFTKTNDKNVTRYGGPAWRKWTGSDAERPPSVNEDGFWDAELEINEIDAEVDRFKREEWYRGSKRIKDMTPQELAATGVLEKHKATFVPAAKIVESKFERYYWKSHMLLDAGIDYVCLDESQRMKSPNSTTHMACMDLARAPMRRISSGTLMPNNPSDLYWQMKFADPKFFDYDFDEFKQKFGDEFDTRNNVTKWNETALRNIRSAMSEAGGVTMRRDRWRYILPKKVVRIHKAQLSDEAQSVYDDMVESEFNKILSNPKMVARLEEYAADELNAAALPDDILNKLSRLDQFISAPEKDPVFGAALAGLPNAKVEVIDKLLGEHNLDDPAAGKVLIFTSYKNVAATIIERSSFASRMLYYDAEKKKSLDAFADRDNRHIMVLSTVDQSLREGHNMQYVSRMIRINMPWAPGPMEQAWGRAFRTGSTFETVIQDLILMHLTLDVSKFKRVTYKRAVTAVVNSGYEPTGTLEQPIMNLDTLRGDINFESLDPYIEEGTRIETFEEEESERSKVIYGTYKYDIASNTEIAGSETVDLDLLKLPERTDRPQGRAAPPEKPRVFFPFLPTVPEVRAWLTQHDVYDFIPASAKGEGVDETPEAVTQEAVKVFTRGDRVMRFTYHAGGERVTLVQPTGVSRILSVRDADRWAKQLKKQGWKNK